MSECEECMGSCKGHSVQEPKSSVATVKKSPKSKVPQEDKAVVEGWAQKNAPKDTTFDACYLWNRNFRVNYWRETPGKAVIAERIIVKSHFVSVRGAASEELFVHLHEN